MNQSKTDTTRLSLAVLAALAIAAGLASADQNGEKEAAPKAVAPVKGENYRYLYQIALAQRELQANQVARAGAVLDECAPDLRSWEWNYLKGLCHTEVKSFEKETRGFWDVAFSPDGERIAVTGLRQVHLWEAETGREILSFDDHEGWVGSVVFCPDGKRICSAGFKTIKIWDAATGKELLSIPAHEMLIRGIAYSPDGSRIVSASGKRAKRGEASGEFKVWNAETGEKLLTISEKHWVNSVRFSPDGEWIASGSGDLATIAPARPGTLKIWNAKTGEEVTDFLGHEFWITSVAFSPDGKFLASCSESYSSAQPGEVILQDASTGEVIRTIKGRIMGFNAVTFSPDSQVLSALGGEGVKQWDVATGREVHTLRIRSHPVFGLAASPDGNRIATGGATVWDGTTGEKLFETKGHRIRSHVTGLAFSPDSTRLASAGWGGYLGTEVDGERKTVATPHEVKICDAKTGEELLTLDGGGHGVAFSPEGRLIASGDPDGSVKIWNAADGELVSTLHGHSGGATRVAFSADGRRLVSGGGDQTVRIWDPLTCLETLTLYGHTASVTGVGFSPDGHRIVSDPLASRLRQFAEVEDRLVLDEFQKRFGRPDGTRSIPATWQAGYASGINASWAMFGLARHAQVKKAAYRDLVIEVADAYLDSLPGEDVDVWPMSFAHVISAQIAAYRFTDRTVYLAEACRYGRMAIQIFWQDRPLPRASFKTDHYETITGCDSLALALLEVHVALHDLELTLPLNSIDR